MRIYRVAGGESFTECGQRVVKAFDDIFEIFSGNILIVGHAGVNRLILCNVLGIRPINLLRITQDYGCLNIIKCRNSNRRVELTNDIINNYNSYF